MRPMFKEWYAGDLPSSWYAADLPSLVPACTRSHDPGPETLQAYADVVRAQDEVVESAARRAREEEDRQLARRKHRIGVLTSPTVQYHAGAQFVSLGAGLRYGLWIWLLCVGFSLCVAAFCAMLEA